MRDLDIGIYYLPSQIQHALLEIQSFHDALFFYGRSVKNIVHCYSLLDLDIGR